MITLKIPLLIRLPLLVPFLFRAQPCSSLDIFLFHLSSHGRRRGVANISYRYAPFHQYIHHLHLPLRSSRIRILVWTDEILQRSSVKFHFFLLPKITLDMLQSLRPHAFFITNFYFYTYLCIWNAYFNIHTHVRMHARAKTHNKKLMNLYMHMYMHMQIYMHMHSIP